MVWLEKAQTVLPSCKVWDLSLIVSEKIATLKVCHIRTSAGRSAVHLTLIKTNWSTDTFLMRVKNEGNKAFSNHVESSNHNHGESRWAIKLDANILISHFHKSEKVFTHTHTHTHTHARTHPLTGAVLRMPSSQTLSQVVSRSANKPRTARYVYSQWQVSHEQIGVACRNPACWETEQVARGWIEDGGLTNTGLLGTVDVLIPAGIGFVVVLVSVHQFKVPQG